MAETPFKVANEFENSFEIRGTVSSLNAKHEASETTLRQTRELARRSASPYRRSTKNGCVSKSDNLVAPKPQICRKARKVRKFSDYRDKSVFKEV